MCYYYFYLFFILLISFRLKGEVKLTFISHEGFLGTQGEFLSYENMGIDGFVGNEKNKDLILGAPYTGQFQSLAQQQKDVSNVFFIITQPG